MTTSAEPGPRSFTGLFPPASGPTPYIGGPAAIGIPENPDAAPMLSWLGMGVRDPRYQPRIGQGPLSAGGYANQDCGWYYAGQGILCADFVPSALVTNNIAIGVHTVAGTPVALAAASTGITIAPAGGTPVLATGRTIPAGAVIIDGAPNWVGSGPSDAFAFWNPANGCSRGLSVVSTSGGTVSFKITGVDLYGVIQTETLVANAATAVNTKKTYKAIISIVPATTDASHTYSFGTIDLYGFAISVSTFPMVSIFWGPPASAQVLITAQTGFVAADATTPSLTTGDPRGTYATQTASDGTNRLTIFAALPFGVIGAANYAAVVAALLGKPTFGT